MKKDKGKDTVKKAKKHREVPTVTVEASVLHAVSIYLSDAAQGTDPVTEKLLQMMGSVLHALSHPDRPEYEFTARRRLGLLTDRWRVKTAQSESHAKMYRDEIKTMTCPHCGGDQGYISEAMAEYVKGHGCEACHAREHQKHEAQAQMPDGLLEQLIQQAVQDTGIPQGAIIIGPNFSSAEVRQSFEEFLTNFVGGVTNTGKRDTKPN